MFLERASFQGEKLGTQDKRLLQIEKLRKYFPVKKSLTENLRRKRKSKAVHAVESISFSVQEGKILGLVGESGCGKTTTGRLISLLEKPDSGKIYFEGKDISRLSPSEITKFRRKVQFVFQNPYDSLDPKFTVFESLEEPLLAHKIAETKDARKQIIEEMMAKVGIPLEALPLYPSKLSGGQRQRVAFARAFMLDPKLLIADEPVSMLDASVRASILNMLFDLRRQTGASVILITHDIATARHICDSICVMYLGEIVEIASSDEIVKNPLHPYTRGLLAAIPRPDPDKQIKIELKGEVGSSSDPPVACRLHPRCPYAYERCRVEAPALREILPGHFVACHRSEELFIPNGKENEKLLMGQHVS